ncbi:MAG: hypothetical protein ACKOWF_13830 [Chloroflexota bacterium]
MKSPAARALARLSEMLATRRQSIAALALSLPAAASVSGSPAAAEVDRKRDSKRRRRRKPAYGSCEPTGRRCDSSKNQGRRCSKCCTRHTVDVGGKRRCACRPDGMAAAPRGASTCCSGRALGGVCVPAGGNCSSSSDCTGASDTCTNGVCTCGGAVCAGICVDGACRACARSSECASGLVCLSGQCGLWQPVATVGQYNSPSADADAFSSPENVSFNGDGLIMAVADNANNRVALWTRPNARSFDWTPQSFVPAQTTTAGSADGKLDGPETALLTPDGLTLYIADADNDRVVVWTRAQATDTTWTFQSKFGSYGTDGSAPQDIDYVNRVWVSPDQLRVYVSSFGTDRNNARVLVWARSTATATDWTWQYNVPGDGTNIDGTGPAQFDKVWGAWLTPDELTMYVADGSDNDRVSVWTRTSIASTNTWQHQYNFGSEGESGNQLDSPETAVPTSDGLLIFVVDQDNDRLSVWARDSASSQNWWPAVLIGDEISALLEVPGGFDTPDDFQTLYIADTDNERVAIWSFVPASQ